MNANLLLAKACCPRFVAVGFTGSILHFEPAPAFCRIAITMRQSPPANVGLVLRKIWRICHALSHPTDRLGKARRSSDQGHAVWVLRHTDLHRRPHRRCHDRTPGDQRRDGPALTTYVGKVLVPEPDPGTMVIPDNLATHKNAAAAKAMRDAGCWFLFLPPCRPDLNPIKTAFSKLKAHLRRIGARAFTDMVEAIAQVCDLSSL